MKKFFKNSLKMIAAGMFVAAMGFGMFTSLNITEGNGNVTLAVLLKTATAQTEGGGNGYDGRCKTCIGWNPITQSYETGVEIVCWASPFPHTSCTDTGCLSGLC